MQIPKAFRSPPFWIFFIIIAVSLVIHLILRSDISGSAVLYVGIPTVVAGLLLPLMDSIPKTGWKSSFARVSLFSLIIMLASSAILFEGFICVVMFMPIYFGVILIVFLIRLAYEYNKSRRRMHLHILPLLLLAASLEGITPELSFNRYNEVTSTKIVHASITQIKSNLLKPVELKQQRHWLLSIFPMPYQLDINSLTVGEVHTAYYRYHRWFVTNTHEGTTQLRVAENSADRIRMEVLDDTSYLATYLKMYGTEIKFKSIDTNTTEVKLTVKYDRLLDPAWYFDPLQRFATGLFGKYLIAQMMERPGITAH